MNQQITYRVGRGPQAVAQAQRSDAGTTLVSWIFDTLTMKIIAPALMLAAIFGPSIWLPHR